MTYGWAILVVLVAIGSLAYFGVLSPGQFLPAKCTLQAGIACLDHKATATTVDVVLSNSLGFDIRVDSIKAAQCTTPYAPAGGSTVSNGEKLGPVSVTGCTNAGAKYYGELNVTYTVLETNIQHTNRGQITSRIE